MAIDIPGLPPRDQIVAEVMAALAAGSSADLTGAPPTVLLSLSTRYLMRPLIAA